MIRVAILDDEPKSIISLEWELKRLVNPVHIVGKFGKAETAIQELKEMKPDCVFLDISMPGLDGFRFLEYFQNRDFEVVFVTGYAEHAIQAIRERAFDYLLKPVDNADLHNVVNRIQTKLQQNLIDNSSSFSVKPTQKIPINTANQLILMDPDAVTHCESEGSYSYIHTLDQGKILVSKRLKLLEELFSNFRFHRIHHRFLINLDKVKSYDKSTGEVNLEGGASLPVSRLKKSGFTESLK